MPTALNEGAPRCLARHAADTPVWLVDDWRSYRGSGSLAARNRLVAHYMTTHVKPIAARIHGGLPQQVELDDLVQQGYLGLIDAMDRYDLERDTRFEAFSRRRIFGAIQDYLRSIDTMPRLSRSRSKRLNAVQERFRKEHGRPPSDDELQPLLGLPEPIFTRFLTDHRPGAVVPFSNVHADGEGEADGEGDAMRTFEDRRSAGPQLHAERSDLQRWITRGFDARDRLIVVLYYYEHLTMLEIGHAIGISESRVSQRLESILARLRARLHPSSAEQEFVF